MITKEKKRAVSLKTRIEQFLSNILPSAGLMLYTCSVAFLSVGLFLTTRSASAASVPVIEPLSEVYLSEGQRVSVTVRATDADGDSLYLTTTQRPLGSSFSDNGDGTADFSWVADYVGPFSASGSPYTVRFVASDGSSQSSSVMTIHVQNVNRAPVVSAMDSVFVEAGDTINIQPTAFDPDQDRISWSMSGSPLGAQLRNPNGPAPVELQWAPEKADSGSHTITLTVTDQWGLSASASAVVVVSVGPTFTVSVATDTVFPGERVSIPVSLKNREPISGFEFELHYDPSVMAFISVSNANARTALFESLTYQDGSPSPGDLKIKALADTSAVIAVGPLPAGDGPLFYASFFVSSESNLAGLFLPLVFDFGAFAASDINTLTDTSGGVIISDSIVFVNGGVKIENQSAITRGDINLNGVPFEVADALRFTNYFIDPINFGFDAQQFANSDINSDGVVASIADLVTLLSIVLGDGSAGPRIAPKHNTQINVLFEQNDNQIITRFTSSRENIHGDAAGNAEVGAALLTFVAQTSGVLGALEIDENALPEGFEAKLRQISDTIRVLVYRGIQEGSLAGLSEVRFNLAKSQMGSKQAQFEQIRLVSVAVASVQGVTLQTNLMKSESAVLPEAFELAQNYPNPFNPETEIHYSLSTRANIKLIIYDILGRTVKTLARGTVESGEYVAHWDGTDELGSTVASGIYFYRLTANGSALSKKMTLLK